MKRIVAFLLAALLCLNLAACSKSKKEEEAKKAAAAGGEKLQKVAAEIAALFSVSPDDYDTDSDGLSNYVEIYQTGTHPRYKDTDGNGVADGKEDADGDSLTNAEEVKNGTAPDRPDTDGDRLTDYEEVKNTKTDPLKADTDGDGLSDGDEVELGLDPLKEKTNGKTKDSERKFTQTLSTDNIDNRLTLEDSDAVPSLKLKTKGNINSRVTITTADTTAFGDSRAVLGEPVSVWGKDLGEGEISFKLKEAEEDTEEEKLPYDPHLICKYGEDGKTEYLETTYDEESNTISADIDEEGTYFVLDVENLFDELGLDMPTGEETETDSEGVISSGVMVQADIVFLIDTTGSMGDEISNVKDNVEAFVDVLKDKGISAGLALIDYQDINADGYDSTRVHKNGTSNWFYDMEAYKNAISALTLGYGGDSPECAVDALETARLIDMRPSAGKIFILVTDADYKVANRYGIPSMEAEIDLLINAGVTCAVVSAGSEEDDYFDLYDATGGIWANIYGDFYEELTLLADKIGTDIVGSGYWIYLDGPVPVPVRLDEEPAEGSEADTDGDGIYDIDELEGATPSGTIDLDDLLTRVSKGVITDTNYGVVEMYKYKSNPVEADTDYDGIPDTTDDDPRKNSFSGEITRLDDGDVESNGEVAFTVDYSSFFKSSSVYNKDLSALSALFAADAYDNVFVEVMNGATLEGNHTPEELATLFGMKHVVFAEIESEDGVTDDGKAGGDGDVSKIDNDVTEILVGHREVCVSGSRKDVVMVVVRGTNGTYAEWSSNFDVGADTYDYLNLVPNEDEWTDRTNHKGFDVTANRVKEYVDEYIESYIDSSVKPTMWITGHSRGAGISNILGAKYADEGNEIFVYTFASPNTTTKSEDEVSKYTSIFNVVNEDDMIPTLPLESWGFRKYGMTGPYSVSVEAKFEDKKVWGDRNGTFEAMFGDDYNNNNKVQSTLSAFEKVASNREELYVYTYEEDTMQLYGINRFDGDKADASMEKAREKLPLTMQRYCEFNVVEGKNIFGGDVKRACSYQTPAYFMQSLAFLASRDGFGSQIGAVISKSVADKYDDAKLKFVLIGNDWTGGMNHPHWPETYYLIARNDNF